MRYYVNSYWGPRREGPEQCAERFLRMLDALGAIDPVFDNWLFRGGMKVTALEAIRGPKLVQRIADTIARSDDGEASPVNGYSFGAFNSPRRGPRGIVVSIYAGSYAVARYYINRVMVETDRAIEPDPAIVTAPIFKAAMLAVAAAWDVTWCAALPAGLLDFEQPRRQPSFGPGWMTYVSPRFAPLLAPPPSLTVERTPEGGLVMIATEERFTTENPAHLAAARAIETALEPLNALPWPPEAEPQAAERRSPAP